MQNQNFMFIIFCLIVTMGLMKSYDLFQAHFSPHKEDQALISKLKVGLEEKDLQLAGLQNQILDLQQEVAMQLPALQGMDLVPGTFELRNLASISQRAVQPLELSSALHERALAEFKRQDFHSSAQLFSQMATKYPTSPLLVQAYFFRAESLFLNGEHQACLDVIDEMMLQFPQHELTGFIMLRMGQILQARSRTEEALEVYKTISSQFSQNEELKKQAELLARSVE
jgi:TolA-binding protein